MSWMTGAWPTQRNTRWIAIPTIASPTMSDARRSGLEKGRSSVKWGSRQGRSRDAYDSIEKNMVTLEKQLMPAMPSVEMVNATIMAINTEYNMIVQQITKEARDANAAK